MPRINRRRTIRGWLVTEILLNLGKGSAGIDSAEADFLNRVPHAVANVVGTVQIASIGRLRHQDANVLCVNGSIGKLQIDHAALSVFNYARGESLPFALRSLVEIKRAFSDPIFNLVVCGIGARP